MELRALFVNLFSKLSDMKKYSFNVEKVTEELIQWIRDWFEVNGKGCNAVIGISGGKDSTTVAALCCKALGADRVIGVMMPCGDQKDISDSIMICKHLGIRNYTVNIKDAVDGVLGQMEAAGVEITKLTRTNLPPRIRMSTLYAVSQSNNGRVSNNCNKSEDVMGYSTRYGDSVGDFSPLSELTTVEIVQIADYLGVPYELSHKTPIDGLNFNPDGSYVTDEQNMGVSYNEIHQYVRLGGLPQEKQEMIAKREKANEFKLLLMPKYTPGEDLLYTQE